MSESHTDDLGKTYAPLAEVATAYGVSVDTIRRRLKRGELEGRRETTPQGFRWLAAMPDTAAGSEVPGSPPSGGQASQGSADVVVVQRDHEFIETLQRELELRNREIARLHEVIAHQAQAIERATAAIPASVSTPAEQPPPNTDTPHHETIWKRFWRSLVGER